MTQSVENLSATLSFLASVEPAARKRLALELGDLGEQALAAQRALVPVKTGRLRDALSIDQAINGMRVRVGILRLEGYSGLKKAKKGRDGAHAFLIEYGVKAGSAWAERLNKQKGRTVKVGKTYIYPRTTYPISWGARAAHPFVHQESRFDQLLIAVQDRFWSEVLNDAGA